MYDKKIISGYRTFNAMEIKDMSIVDMRKERDYDPDVNEKYPYALNLETLFNRSWRVCVFSTHDKALKAMRKITEFLTSGTGSIFDLSTDIPQHTCTLTIKASYEKDDIIIINTSINTNTDDTETIKSYISIFLSKEIESFKKANSDEYEIVSTKIKPSKTCTFRACIQFKRNKKIFKSIKYEFYIANTIEFDMFIKAYDE